MSNKTHMLIKTTSRMIIHEILSEIKLADKRPVYIFAFGEYHSKQVNVSGIQHLLAQF